MKKLLTLATFLLFLTLGAYAQDLEVKKVRFNACPQDIPALFARKNVEYQKIDCVNWKDAYPYNPNTRFAIAYTKNAILLHFIVESEKGVLASVKEDLGPVYRDACVEFFFTVAPDSTYYNIECNCLGKILMQYGNNKGRRIDSTAENLGKIKRWASLPQDFNGDGSQTSHWEIALEIPFDSFYRHEIKSMDGKTIKANFYKCGGADENTHFLSWKSISTPRPNFHTPQFFGTLRFNR